MEQRNKAEEKKIFHIKSKFNKALKDYRLIDNNDHILIGLSGGKDSLALVELLGERMKIFVPKFKVTAAHISIENIPYQSDLKYLKEFCSKYNIPFVHKTVRFEEADNKKKTTCFICSWTRRKALFEVAKKTGCNKIALGHHLDDIAETLLLNMFYQGTFCSIPPILKMHKFDMAIIRPLCLIPEKNLKELEQIRAYKKQNKNCPYEKESSRNEAKKLISKLEEWNPSIRQSLWSSMENIKTDYLPEKYTV